MNTKKIQRFKLVYPWFGGLAGDLLFWVAVDTLFLQIAKGFAPSDIVLLSTFSNVLGMAFQFPILKIVEKIGNSASLKIGVILAFISAVSLTFGNSFYIMVIGVCLRDMSASFKSMMHVALRHNLELVGEEAKFIQYSTRSNITYSTITMLISLFSGLMFNWNNYLPMYCCIAVCAICIFLSFYMTDYSEKEGEIKPKKKADKEKTHYSKLILLAIVSFGIFFALVITGQENGKLFIQDELLKDYNEEITSLVLAAMLFVSRTVRLFSNVIFSKIHQRFGDKLSFLLAALLTTAFTLLLTGSFIKGASVLKFAIMGTGYLLILFSRDPFQVYTNNLVMRNSSSREQSKILILKDLSRKLLATLFSLSFSLVLRVRPMMFVIVLYIIFAIAELGICIYLYSIAKRQTAIK